MKKIYNEEGKKNEITITNGAEVTKDWPALQLDVEYYQAFLDDEDITDAQKKELIETIWNIVVTFVDLGFGIEPVQQAIEAGQNHTQDKSPTDSDFVKRADQADKLNCTNTEPK
ncbi:MAG: hypothetical protein DHS20C07_16770 [Methyloligella sp.]|nr:MAG: hypothetical protein DHS20C07_16770 [Methyloligella sp.]